MTAPASHTYLNTRAAILADRLLSERDFSELTEHTLEQLGRDFGVTDLLEEKTSSATINRATER
ncbi:MAG: hypothetical protein ABW140_19175, partial [Candidatus Sedimenticola sp. 6PFRAG1]